MTPSVFAFGIPSPTELVVLLVVGLVLFVFLRVPGVAKRTGEAVGALQTGIGALKKKFRNQ